MNIGKSLIVIGILTGPILFFVFLSTGRHDILHVPFYGASDSVWVDVDGERQLDTVIWYTIPDFAFTNQNNETISKADVEGKIFVANFFFSTCASICPAMNAEMAEVQKKFKNDPDVLFLSHTVDPATDTPEVLAGYAQQYNAVEGQWHFLTGDKKTIYDMGRKGYFLPVDDGDGGEHDFLHSEQLVLIDHVGRIRGFYDGLNHGDVNSLMQDIQKLKMEEFIPWKKKRA